MKKEHLKILRELMKKPCIPKAVKERHGDIEEAIVARGGRRGSLRADA